MTWDDCVTITHLQSNLIHFNLISIFFLGKEKNKKTEDLKKELELDVHKVELDQLCKRFSTDIAKGLTTAQAKAGNEEHGLNQLTPPPTTPEWVKFCQNLFSGFACLLWLGAILCFIAYSIQVTIIDIYFENVLLKVFWKYFVKMIPPVQCSGV